MLRRDVSVSIRDEAGHLIALLFHPFAAFQHGAVLHRCGDNVASHMAVLPAGGLDGPVVALGAAGGEIEPLRFAAQGSGHGPAPVLYPLFHIQPHLILGTGIAELLRQHLIHGVRNFPWYRGGGGVVQIDHIEYSFCWGLLSAENQRIIKAYFLIIMRTEQSRKA